MTETRAEPGPPTSPVRLLALGLASGDEQELGLGAGIELGDFLCACPDLELFGCLGRGGMGIVYRARQIQLDRIVAVKLMSPQLSHDPEFAARFEREARAMARLDHPGIVRVHDFGVAAGVHYLVMELVDGPNLRELIQSHSEIEPELASKIVVELCDALAYAHGRGVVHRDIKPENVLLDGQGRVRIADFGLAKLQHQAPRASATRTRRILGTPLYMAPEQITDPESVDHRSDIFAIGVVFYEALTGRLPLGRFPPPSELGHGSEKLDDIVLRALESSPERRFQSAAEISEALTTGALEDSSAATVVGRAVRSRRRARLLALTASLGLSAAVGVAAFTAAQSDGPELAVVEAPALSPPQPEAAAAPPVDLERWPAKALTRLAPETVGVVGFDWSELRQVPLMRLLARAYADKWQSSTCPSTVLDRTYKVLLAFGPDHIPSEALILGDWSAEDLDACLELVSSISSDPEGPDFSDADQLGARLHAVKSVHFSSRDLTDGRPHEAWAIAAHEGRILISFDGGSQEELEARLRRDGANLGLCSTVLGAVDVHHPIWVFGAAQALPLGMTSVAGEFELWDELGVELRFDFPDEARAAEGRTMVESYANIVKSLSDGAVTPEFDVALEDRTVTLSGTLRISEAALANILLGEHDVQVQLSPE